MLSIDASPRHRRREPLWSRWDVVCAISLVAACMLISFVLPTPGLVG